MSSNSYRHKVYKHRENPTSTSTYADGLWKQAVAVTIAPTKQKNTATFGRYKITVNVNK